MSKQCKGCGVILQYENKDSLGYTPKETSDYCQRCFRLTHYNDVTINMQTGINNDELLRKVSELDALVVWVVDMVDFASSMIKGLHRHLLGKDILLVCTKSDLLPRDTNPNKIARFIQKQLRNEQIHVKGIVVSPNLHKQDEESIEQVQNALEEYRDGKDIVLLGQANAGKSTLLNALLNSHDLTTSNQPGTTIDLNPISYNGYTLYDTPGLVNHSSCLTYANKETLQDIVVQKQLNPTKFQLRDSQSLAIGGIVRIDLIDCKQVSAVFYVSNNLEIHRGKQENADELWKEHYGEDMLVPTIGELTTRKTYSIHKKIEKLDIVVSGLGWICIHGNVKDIIVYAPKDIDVRFREAMI